jgi:hypothetical protein
MVRKEPPMSLALALRNKQMLALFIIALVTAVIIVSLVLSLAYHLNIWSIFTPGKTVQGFFN